MLVFVASSADSNLFIYNHDTHLVFLLLYVDDIIVTGNHPSFISSLIHSLSQEFFFFFFGRNQSVGLGLLLNQKKNRGTSEHQTMQGE